MRVFTKAVPLGILAVTGLLICLLWQKPSGTAVQAPGRLGSTASPAAAQSRDLSRSESLSAQSESSPDSIKHTLALIHSNLRGWFEAERNGSPEDDEPAMQALEALLTDQNAAAIIQSLSAQELDTPFGYAGLRHWMNASPVQASNWVAARPDATRDETWAVAQGWVANSKGLQNYVDQLPDSAWKQDFLQEAASGLSNSDPGMAIQLAERMTPGADQTGLLQSVAGDWIDKNPEATLAWINSIGDSTMRESLIAAAAQSYALTDPSAAATWLVSAVASETIVKDAVMNITQTWVTQDPAAAANWVSQFPEGGAKTAGVDIVSKYWKATDPASANAWLRTLSSAQH